MENVFLSIILPVYNVEKYIRNCMDSFFRQGLDEKDFELIVVDDGTQDRSMEVIDDIVHQHSNITVIHQENQGVSVARNTGIAKAKGDYVLMPDSDDMLIDNSLPYLLDIARSTQSDLIVADFLRMSDKNMEYVERVSIFQQDGKVEEKNGEELFLQDSDPNEPNVWRTLYRRDFLLEHHLSFVPGIKYQDVPFTHECYLKAKRCVKVSWLLYIYRKGHPAAATSSFDLKRINDHSIAIAKTWELMQLNLSPQLKEKLQNNVFDYFCVNLYNIWTRLETKSEKYQAIDFLKQQAPNLSFGSRQQAPNLPFRRRKKQKLYTFLYRYLPHVLIRVASYLR